MFASILGDVGNLVLYGAAAIISISVLVLVAGRRFRNGELKLGPLEMKLGVIEDQIRSVASVAEQVNRAVNQVPPHMPTLVNRVARIEEINRHLLLSVRMIAGHVGADIPPLREPDDDRRSVPPDAHRDNPGGTS